MVDLDSLVVACGSQSEIVGATNAVVRQLPSDVRRQFVKIISAYLHRYGLEGVFERMNNRSVATILAEYDGIAEPDPLVSGEADGVRYHLYEAPGADRREDSEPR